MALPHFDLRAIFRCAVDFAHLLYRNLRQIEAINTPQEGIAGEPNSDAIEDTHLRLVRALLPSSYTDENLIDLVVRDLTIPPDIPEKGPMRPEDYDRMEAGARLLRDCQCAAEGPEAGKALEVLVLALMEWLHDPADLGAWLQKFGDAARRIWRCIPNAEKTSLEAEHCAACQLWGWPRPAAGPRPDVVTKCYKLVDAIRRGDTENVTEAGAELYALLSKDEIDTVLSALYWDLRDSAQGRISGSWFRLMQLAQAFVQAEAAKLPDASPIEQPASSAMSALGTKLGEEAVGRDGPMSPACSSDMLPAGAGKYDPRKRQPTTLGELEIWLLADAAWKRQTNPQTYPLVSLSPPPIPGLDRLSALCQAKHGGYLSVERVCILIGEYALARGVSRDEARMHTLKQIAACLAPPPANSGRPDQSENSVSDSSCAEAAKSSASVTTRVGTPVPGPPEQPNPPAPIADAKKKALVDFFGPGAGIASTPNEPKPPNAQIIAAVCDVGLLLENAPSDRVGHKAIHYVDMIRQLQAKGHSRPTARWAVYLLMTTGRLFVQDDDSVVAWPAFFQWFYTGKPLLESENTSMKEDLPPYRPEEQEWFGPPPKELSLAFAELKLNEKRFQVVIMTAVEVERDAVLRLMAPLSGRKKIVRTHVGQETYFLGRFGAFPVVVSMCAMGSTNRDAAILATQAAIDLWKPDALIMPGIAFGADEERQQIADVLIATYVIPYEYQRVGQITVSRAARPQTGAVLLNRFRNVRWNFMLPNSTQCNRRYGPLLSGEKLVDDLAFKTELLGRHPEAIGGDMEGYGVEAACSRKKVEWIVTKAICDWGDGKKRDNHQALAAAAAASLVHSVLSDSNVLTGLGIQSAGAAEET